MSDLDKEIDDLRIQLMETLSHPLTQEINDRWVLLFDLLRKKHPEAGEQKIDKMARELTWGCR